MLSRFPVWGAKPDLLLVRSASPSADILVKSHLHSSGSSSGSTISRPKNPALVLGDNQSTNERTDKHARSEDAPLSADSLLSEPLSIN